MSSPVQHTYKCTNAQNKWLTIGTLFELDDDTFMASSKYHTIHHLCRSTWPVTTSLTNNEITYLLVKYD